MGQPETRDMKKMNDIWIDMLKPKFIIKLLKTICQKLLYLGEC